MNVENAKIDILISDDRYAHIIPIERQKIQISNTETLIRFIEAELESRKKKRKKNHGKHSR